MMENERFENYGDQHEEISKSEISSRACTNTENADLIKTPAKITHFFPVLKSKVTPESEITEKNYLIDNSKSSSKQSSSFYNMSASDTPIESESPKPLPNKGVPRVGRNLKELLNSALKTSISEALRKHKANQSQTNAKKSMMKQTESLLHKIPPAAAEDLDFNKLTSGESEKKVSSFQDDKIETRLDKSNIQMRAKNAIRNTIVSAPMVSVIASQSVNQSNSTVIIKTEVMDSEETINSDAPDSKEIAVGREVVSTDIVQPQNDVAKCRKSKKRHFKGATYSLYLTPNRKKKKISKKPGTDSCCKDDEMSLSTENGSCMDSSDGCSMFSEDFNTSSEKSLVDDEACTNSGCSPLFALVDQCVDTKIEPQTENDSLNTTQTMSNPDLKSAESDSGIALSSSDNLSTNENIDNETLLISQNSNEIPPSSQCSNEILSTQSSNETSPSSECNNEIPSSQSSNEIPLSSQSDPDIMNSSSDKNSNIEMTSTNADSQNAISEILANCDNIITSKLLPKISSSKKAISTCQILSDSALISKLKILTEISKSPTSAVSSTTTETTSLNFSGSTDEEGKLVVSNADDGVSCLPTTKIEDSSKNITLSTIATSVKSRQRIKRKFTDDIIDTDVGILSLISMPVSSRKTKADLPTTPPHTQDIIENFKITLTTEARGGPLTKTEAIFSSKQAPIDICSCKGLSYYVKVGDSPPNFYCQAVDSYEDKLVGCSNPVITFRLVRASVRIPFTVMCEMHLWRLQQHHCCPRCGVFCSQGTFMQCRSDKSEAKMLHLYHEKCRSGSEEKKLDFCLHCGDSSELKIVQLDCDMISPPAFFQSQHSLILPTKARISFNTSEGLKENETLGANSDAMFRMEEADVTLSPSGLLKEEDIHQLEAMLSSLNTIEISDIPDYPVFDLYTAACNGDTSKVLHMLAKGVNPNEKFVDFNESTALHVASEAGHVLIAHLLLQSGAVSDSMNRTLRTPLMLATEKNQEDVVEYLIKRKAPINTKGEVGMTSLHVAARDGHFKLCRLFIESGYSQINAQDDGGWTPIVWASEHGHTKIVRLLIDRGGDPNIRDNEGNTALHWAAFCGTSEVCVILINHGCNVNEANELGDTPLHIAARQDNYKCIDLFLSRCANLDVENKAGEMPVDCCKNDPCCKSAQAMQLAMRLKNVFEKHHHRSDKILSKDIALGRERYPIRCVNGADDASLDLKEFLYVTENCETCPIRIDRCITSLQHCMCGGDCTLSSCTCSAISFKCWYDPDGHLLPEFNMLDPPLLFECNRACCCDAGICRNRVVQRGMSCRLELIRTIGKGWGVRTLKDIPKGTFICEYVGELITDSEADTRQDDSYLFDLDNKDGETYCLDARHFGNISRFINHLCEPNLVPVKVFVDHQDLSFPRIAFFSLRDIFQYEELGFDYGEKFWVIKSKSFTCSCGAEKCKYSKDTIKETLENYKKRNQEEMQDLCNL